MKSLATVLAIMFSIAAGSVSACPGEKMTNDGKTSTPVQPPKT